MVALAAIVAPALLLAAIPAARTDVPVVDQLLALIDLPLSSPLALLVLSVQFAAASHWWRTAPLPTLLIWAVFALFADSLDATNLAATAGWPLLIWGAASHARAGWSAAVVAVTTPMVLSTQMMLIGPQVGESATSIVILSYVLVVPLWLAGMLVRRHRLGRARSARVCRGRGT